MSEKAYCEDCKRLNFLPGKTRGDRIEFCNIEKDDYHSKKHPVREWPEILNRNNDCPHFIKTEGKED